MNKKFLSHLLIFLIIPISFLFTGCDNFKLKNITVELINNEFEIVNNQIEIEWENAVNFSVNDFKVLANYANGNSKEITKKIGDKGDYICETNFPVSDLDPLFERVDIGNGEKLYPKIGQYYFKFFYKEIQPYELIVNIVKSKIVINNYHWGSTLFDYDGQEKTVSILPNEESVIKNMGINIEYLNNKKTNAGVYTVGVCFTPNDSVHYESIPQTASTSWEIKKGIFDVSGVSLVEDSFVFNGEEKSVEINETTLPQGVTAEIISGKTGTNVGTFIATVKFTHSNSNYNEISNKEIVWNINN